MTFSLIRPASMLAMAVALASCGGGGDDLTIDPTTTGSGQFFFKTLVETDSSYNVRVKSLPSNAKECKEFDNTGKVAFTITTVQIVCTLNQFELKGTVTGLTGNNLVLVNGADRVPVTAGATSFTMAKVNQDAPYGVAILTQPDNQTCSVANGTGTVGANDITNVAVTCGPRT